jgi:hypothetical protein
VSGCRVAVLVIAAALGAQDDSSRRPWPQGEGALGNDVFLPASERATASLAQGDLAITASPPDLSGALDAWRSGLAESEPIDCVASPRGTESVERAVLRRLRAGGAELEAAWRVRFESSAGQAFDAARGNADALARAARSWPMTRAGTRAALALADRALEEGDAGSAATWLERADAQADARDADLKAAIARRRSALAALGREAASPQPGSWDSAQRLEVEARVTLASTQPPREGIRPGLAFLRDGRIAVQCADTLHLVGQDAKAASFPLRALVREFGWSWIEPFVERGEAWILRPATDGERIALVAGRAARTRGNALLLLEPDRGRKEPSLAWGYSDGGFRSAAGGPRTLEETLGPGLWEFEPGPVFAGGAVFAQLRQWTAEGDQPPSLDESAVRAWCFAFDAETGLPRWKTLLAVGPSAKVELWGTRGIARPADPLVELEGRLFAGTAIGAGVCLGRDGDPIWSLRNRRAPEGAARWRCGAALRVAGASAAVRGSLLWTPSDSDRMYLLPDLRAPAEIDGHVEAIGMHGDRVLLLSGTGDRGALATLDLASGAASRSIELPRGDRLAGGILVGGTRAIVASDLRVDLIDLTRDLYLLDSIPLEGADADPAAGIAARSDRAYVTSERALWILRAR